MQSESSSTRKMMKAMMIKKKRRLHDQTPKASLINRLQRWSQHLSRKRRRRMTAAQTNFTFWMKNLLKQSYSKRMSWCWTMRDFKVMHGKLIRKQRSKLCSSTSRTINLICFPSQLWRQTYSLRWRIIVSCRYTASSSPWIWCSSRLPIRPWVMVIKLSRCKTYWHLRTA